MKKCLCILLVLCSFSFPLRAFEEDAFERIKPVAMQRLMSYCLGHPALIHHCYALFYEGISVIKEGIAQSDRIAAQYSNEKEVRNYLDEVEHSRILLQRQDFLVKSLGFMTLGFYERHALLDEQDLKVIQFKILTRLFQQIEIEQTVKQGNLTQEGAQILSQGQECELMKEIKAFCQASSDPFFSHQLYPLIKDFDSREEMMKYYFDISLYEEDEEKEEPTTEAGRALRAVRNEFSEKMDALIDRYFADEVICDLILSLIPEN